MLGRGQWEQVWELVVLWMCKQLFPAEDLRKHDCAQGLCLGLLPAVWSSHPALEQGWALADWEMLFPARDTRRENKEVKEW